MPEQKVRFVVLAKLGVYEHNLQATLEKLSRELDLRMLTCISDNKIITQAIALGETSKETYEKIFKTELAWKAVKLGALQPGASVPKTIPEHGWWYEVKPTKIPAELKTVIHEVHLGWLMEKRWLNAL